MKGFICDNCGAEIKEGKKPSSCPMCHRTKFIEHDFPEQSEQDKKSLKKYKEAIEILDKYEEGCDPRTMADADCGCGKHNYD